MILLTRPVSDRSALLRTAFVVLAALITIVGAVAPTVVSAQPISLRPLADDAGLAVGAAVDADALGDDAYRQLLADHVNLVSTRSELSMAVIQPEPGVFDFSRADAIVDFAVANDMPVRGHELIGRALPGWVNGGTWTADSLGQVLRDHVSEVVARYRDTYPGVVTQWDVVGDAFLPDGSLRPNIWQQVIGDDYLRIAFDAARAADPDADLFYDDFYDDLAVTQDAVASGVAIVPGANAERATCDAVAKCVGVRDRISALLADGAPIDGIGFQSHLFSPDPADFSELTSWVGDLELLWAVTEFDVPLPITETTNAASLEFQAAVYAQALAACADAPNCNTFVTWGITDRFSPIPGETGGAFGGALWFDANDAAKPAFDAMAQVLTERALTTTTVPPEPTQSTLADSPTEPATTTSSDNDANALVPILVGLGALGLIAAVIVISRKPRGETSSPERDRPPSAKNP
jgi:endo-1,4-beta-xylanase